MHFTLLNHSYIYSESMRSAKCNMFFLTNIKNTQASGGLITSFSLIYCVGFFC